MPHRPRVFVDSATYHVDFPLADLAWVFASPEEEFGRQVDVVEVELRRR